MNVQAWDGQAIAEQPWERRRVNTVKAAEIAGVTTRTIYNWMRSGRVEFVRTPSGAVRIYVDTLFLRVPDNE